MEEKTEETKQPREFSENTPDHHYSTLYVQPKNLGNNSDSDEDIKVEDIVEGDIKDREGEMQDMIQRISKNISHSTMSEVSISMAQKKEEDNDQNGSDIINKVKKLSNIDQKTKEAIYATIDQIHKIINQIQTIIMKHHKDQELQTRFQGFLNTIMITMQQNYNLIKVLEVCDKYKKQYRKNEIEEVSNENLEEKYNKELEKIYDDYQVLELYRIQAKQQKLVNPYHVEQIMKTMMKYLTVVSDSCTKFEETETQKIKKESKPSSIWNDMKIVYSKFRTFMEVFPYVMNVDKDDLFCFDRQQEKWKNLENHFEERQIATPEKIAKGVKKIYDGMSVANAMIYKASQQDGKIKQAVYKNMSAVYYFINKKNSTRKAQIFLSEPNMHDAFTVWNLPEIGVAKYGMKMLYASIDYMKKIYIQRLYTPITVESLQQEVENGTINKISKEKNPNLKIKDIESKDLFYKKIFKKKSKKPEFQDRITIRLMCHETLVKLDQKDMEDILSGKKDSKKLSFLKSLCSMKKEIQVFDKIIIHVHGGGFVSMTSRSFQTCTRRWANWTKVPIFSIDYGLAPKHPYPNALNDIWQAYNWILEQSQNFFNIAPKKVVLTGDSAGGNLICALTARCIKEKVKVPDGILMSYPVLNLSLKRFTPSFLIALDDPILTHTILKLCQDAYLKQDGTNLALDPQVDPYISPLIVSDEILSQFPPTRTIVGTEDPLYDDCFRFLERQLKFNIDSKVIVYKGFPHGFLNFDFPNGLKYASQTVKESADILSELLNL